MRKIVMFNRVSADGFFAPRDGSLDWVIPDDAIDAKGASSTNETDTILFGRKTYDSFESFWPKALDRDPHHEGRKSESIAAMAKFINSAQKVVFSMSLKDVTWKNSKLY